MVMPITKIMANIEECETEIRRTSFMFWVFLALALVSLVLGAVQIGLGCLIVATLRDAASATHKLRKDAWERQRWIHVE